MFTLILVRYLFKLDLLFFWVQEDGGGRRRKVVVRKRPQGVEAPQFSSQPGTDQAPPKGVEAPQFSSQPGTDQAPLRGGGTAVQLTTRYRPSGSVLFFITLFL